MHGKRIVSSLYLYPGQTSAGTSSGISVAKFQDFSAMNLQLNPGNRLITNRRYSGFEYSVTAGTDICASVRPGCSCRPATEDETIEWPQHVAGSAHLPQA